MKVAIMQPCYLPWRGYFALMKQTDCFVHLDDVPLPQGRSFQTRVQIRTAAGSRWLTVPVERHANQLIRDVRIVEDGWRQKHLRTLRQELPAAVRVVSDLYERSWNSLADFNIALIDRLAAALDLPTHHPRSTNFFAADHGWKKLLHICKALGATTYITGHGARNYFDHEAFEGEDIEVMYIDYDVTEYPQPHNTTAVFDPFVTVLDVLAHAPEPQQCIESQLVPWREFMQREPLRTQHEPLHAAG